jgi:hypothetical protein
VICSEAGTEPKRSRFLKEIFPEGSVMSAQSGSEAGPTPEDDVVDGAGADPSPDVQGEGDYRAARKFQWKETEFVRDEGRIEKAAREAADALDGPEGEELERARQTTAEGKAR